MTTFLSLSSQPRQAVPGMARRMGGDAPSRLPRIAARHRAEILRGLAALCWLALSGAALAAGGEHADPAKEAAMRALAARDAPKDVSAQDFGAKEPAKTGYCANIADAAADARFAWQKEQLAAMERQVEERIKLLEEKRAEYEAWLKRRNEFLAKADESVVAVYAKMRPDAAALQLANMPDEAAAALLTKLNARTASAILSEMEAARAAGLARAMSESGRKDATAPAQKKNQRS